MQTQTQEQKASTVKKVLKALIPIVWDVVRKTLINILARKDTSKLIS